MDVDFTPSSQIRSRKPCIDDDRLLIQIDEYNRFYQIG
jgi:hypothetical protein